MPTPSEQKALAFAALVILLGGAARLLSAGSPVPPTADERSGLDNQTAAVESLVRRGNQRKPGGGGRRRGRRRDGGTDTVAGVVGLPFSDVRPDGRPANYPDARGFPPPGPRIDSYGGADNRLTSRSPDTSAQPLDVDVATAEELDRLPGIGPALARRIVANRDSLGPFGSLEGLGRVRGIGDRLRRSVQPRVTFSGRRASYPVRSRYY